MIAKPKRQPKLRQCDGRAFVELNGRRIYLGRWGDAQTRQGYHQAIAAWEARGRGPRAAFYLRR